MTRPLTATATPGSPSVARAPATRALVWRVRSRSVLVRPRPVVVCATLLVVLVVVVLAALSVGSYDLSLSGAAQALAGRGDPGAVFVVRGLRLPRVVTGLLVGAVLALSGALLQALTRNPLGSPDILGLTYGASAGAVLVIVSAETASTPAVAAGALAGGLGIAVLVTGLAWRRGVQPLRLVLVGVGIAFTARALVDLLLSRGNLDDVTQATVWLTGSLSSRTWTDAGPAAVALLLLGPAALGLRRSLDHLALGDDTATGLGVHVQRVKVLTVLVAVGLASLAVTAAGPIAFVAVACAPLASRLTGVPGVPVVTAALTGALLVTSADLVAQDLLPIALPVGVVTAAAGAPVLLWLLTRQVRSGAL